MTDTDTAQAQVFTFQVDSPNPSGLQPGTYCVWIWPEGESELMYRPDHNAFLPAVQGVREQ